MPIVSFIPMFMFAILFGLSMDYEVFLLSRVREEYLATGDNDASVVHGIASTARVITSAALIMISVFLGFALGDDPTIKMFGLGLATAIFVDATIVRMVLVPATMKLMGDANWWMPGMARPPPADVDIEGTASTTTLRPSTRSRSPCPLARAARQDRDESWRPPTPPAIAADPPSWAGPAHRRRAGAQSRHATSSPHTYVARRQAWTPIRFAWKAGSTRD